MILTGNKEYYNGIDTIRYEGKESDNPLAFKYYDPERVVAGKTMREHFKFAIAYWQILLEPKKWRELQSKSKRSKFSHSGGQVKIPSNFNFIVETNPHFPATDENCYPTIELYSHSLKDIVEDLERKLRDALA